VDFTVLEVSPVCRIAGTFSVAGHAGLNRVRFNGKLHGRQLPAGTYQIRARRHRGATVLHVVLVIVAAGAPTPTELERARHENVCASARGFTGTNGTQLAAASTSGRSGTKSEIARNENAGNGGTSMSANSSGGRPSAAPFTPARVSKNAANPLVIGAFALAVLLLGLAAVPQSAVPDPRLTHLLASHRVDVALAGAAALAVALLALALA